MDAANKTFDEVAEAASYDGFPVRYPNWKFDMEYETLVRPQVQWIELEFTISPSRRTIDSEWKQSKWEDQDQDARRIPGVA